MWKWLNEFFCLHDWDEVPTEDALTGEPYMLLQCNKCGQHWKIT